MALLVDVQRETKTSAPLWRWVFGAALVCFFSTSWSFTRSVNATQLVEVSPGRTLLPLLLFVLIGVAGRTNPLHARRVIVGVAGVLVALTAIALPVVINHAIDAGHPAGAWPLDWLVPVHLHLRSN